MAPLIAAAALYATPTKADLITQYAPDYDITPGRVELSVELENNDDGAVYNSYDLPLFYSLSLSLWNLPQNQANYATIDDMTGDWSLTIRPNPIGEVNEGWLTTQGNYSPVAIENVGGIPGVTYENWEATQQNPNQDMMALTLSIPTSQLDGNNNGWSSTDSGDYTINMNTSPTPGMGIGRAGLDSWAAQGYEYNVNIVPEPNTIALLGLGAAALLAARNRRKKEELLNDNP